MDYIDMSDAQRRQTIQTLANAYINAWSTTDAAVRRDLVARVYADEAEFFSAEDGNLRLQGRLDIAANIGQVNERDIQGHGLAIEHRATTINHRAVKVTWQMVSSEGGVALTGMNLLLLNSSGEIAQDFIFIGSPN